MWITVYASVLYYKDKGYIIYDYDRVVPHNYIDSWLDIINLMGVILAIKIFHVIQDESKLWKFIVIYKRMIFLYNQYVLLVGYTLHQFTQRENSIEIPPHINVSYLRHRGKHLFSL